MWLIWISLLLHDDCTFFLLLNKEIDFIVVELMLDLQKHECYYNYVITHNCNYTHALTIIHNFNYKL